ncbi:MAG TPA: PspC domain-containing protein [Mycobacteriales bacterium]|jgi:signal transduction histidine kinase|nr:PspC domain-containing protein [Mycobacteriales bacterium]
MARRLYRRRDDRLVAGVAGGLSDHLGIDVMLLRIGFVISIALGGLGVLLYTAFWVVVPQGEDDADRIDRTDARVQLVAFAALGAAMLLVAQLLGLGASLLWPAAATVTGAAILWRQADESSRHRWRSVADRQRAVFSGARGRTAVRYAAGIALVLTGMGTFLATQNAFPVARRAFLPAVVVSLGLIVVVGPWLLRYWREAAVERTARIREHERVELAGRIHDSMLQTLTLIQRRAEDPEEVRRLVRHSERELRGWLYRSAQPAASLRAMVAAACGEVEDEYDVTINLVVVGDHPAEPAVEPVVQAMREAAVNAAKHAGVRELSVYVEVGETSLEIYIRDRGKGFKPAAIPDDRFGVRESIVARMQRHGGEASIRSARRTGTEVRLTLPLHAAASV